MDPGTGKIYTFRGLAGLARAQAERFAGGKKPLVPLARKPDPNCGHCFGRGHTGKNLTTGEFVPCRCVQKV